SWDFVPTQNCLSMLMAPHHTMECHESVHCSARVGVGVSLANLCRYPAAVADLVSVLLGPGANTASLRRTRPAARLSPGGLTTAGTPCSADPRRQCLTEVRGVLGVQINLICDAVQRERHRFFSIRSVDIIDEEDANLLCHRYSFEL